MDRALLCGAIAAVLCTCACGQLLPDIKRAEPLMREARSPGGSGIFYHTGPVMAGGVNIYYIWYGDWSADATGAALLTTLAQSMGGSPYFNINTTYHAMMNGRDTAVQNVVHYAGSASDAYSQGKYLSSAATPQIVADAIVSGKLPADPNGIYFVLGSADVSENGFCKTSCGWHGSQTVRGVDIKFAFVGNPATQCIHFCSLFGPNFPPPNGDAGADAMTSIIAHELSESVNDPHMDAWFDLNGDESADKCQWTFGTMNRVPVGQPNSYGVYNVTLGGKNFLLQQNWVNAAGGYCAMSY
ncbi:MAG: EXORDIUM family protein [Acidobacteriia bacterium]|nr:EXORDIUM family protein [Terriglobia bacterium]